MSSRPPARAAQLNRGALGGGGGLPTSAFVFLAGVGAGLALLLWRVSTMRTDPEGYTEIAALGAFEIDRAVPLDRADEALRLLQAHPPSAKRPAPPA